MSTKSETGKLKSHAINDPTIAAAPIEQYRALALSLEAVEPKGVPRVLVVTSALPGEGKTLTATNIGITLSSSYRRRVLVLDGDLRRPRLYASLGAVDEEGAAATELSVPPSLAPIVRVKRVGVTMHAMGFTDAPYEDPISILSGPAMDDLFAWAKARFDWVLVDSPPAALVADANILSQRADGVLFVVQAGITPFEAANRALTNLGRERVLGVVMNRVPKDGPDGTYHYYAGYGGYYERATP